MTKIKISLNILLRIIEHNNRLPGHLFFYRLWGQSLQIGADLLQTGAATTNRGNYYKSVHNNVNWKLNFYLKALENSQTKTLGWNPLVAKL